MSQPIESDVSLAAREASRFSRADFMALTKVRLATMVVITTALGFWMRSRGAFDGWAFFHTVFGTSLCALGSGAFNQLMEIEADARMKRTADRPLPARRLTPAGAFAIGWGLCAWGLVHLGRTVNVEAAALAAATLLTYVFIYTPLKTFSVLNTVVGAVSGALPPMIGWAGAAGPGDPGTVFRWPLIVEQPSLFLFSVLFLWQMPHFLAINWMYRDEYLRGGFIMWSNTDETGEKTGLRATLWSALLIPVSLWPALAGWGRWWASIVATALALAMIHFSWRLRNERTRQAAKRLFFYTLMYLPPVLAVIVLGRK